MTQKSVPVPAYDLGRVVTLRQKLSEDVLLPFYGFSHSGPAFEELVQALHRALPSADLSALFQSVRPLAGATIMSEELEELAWRLAGNLHHLRRGIAVPVWTRQLFPEWSAVQVVSVEKVVLARKSGPEKSAARLRLFVLTGLPAGRIIEKTWTVSYVRHLRTELGFARYNRDRLRLDPFKKAGYPFFDVFELTRMRFLVLIAPQICLHGPDFEEVRGTAGCRAWNRLLLERRRSPQRQCPRDYPKSISCHRCPVGYDVCPAACRPVTRAEFESEGHENYDGHSSDRPGDEAGAQLPPGS